MNKIAGFYSLEQDLSEKKSDSENLLKKMKEAQEPSRTEKGIACSRENEAAQKEESEYLNSRFGLIRTGRLSVRPKDGAGCMRAVQRRNLQLERALQRAV